MKITKEAFLSWLQETAIKTVRTMAQSAIGAVGTAMVISEVNWAVVGGTVALSGVMCILMALTNLKATGTTTTEDEEEEINE